MRLRARRIARVLGALLATLLLFPVALIGALQFAPVRDLLRVVAQDAVGELLFGELHIGELESLGPTGLTVRDVVLTDAHQRPAVRVARARIVLSPWPLLKRRVQIDRVEVVRPRVMLVTEADGALNLTQLLRPTPPDPDPRPSSWTIVVGTASVSTGRVEHHTASASTTVDGIALGGSARIGPQGVEVHDGALDVAGAPTVRALDLSWRANGGLDARAQLDLAPELLRLVSAQDALRGRARVELRARRPSDDADLALSVRGQLASAPLALSATIAAQARHAELRLQLDGLDPAELYLGAPRGALDISVDGNLSAKSATLTLDSLDAALAVDAHGELRYGKRESFRLSVDATSRGGAMDATAKLRGLGATLDAELRARTSTHGWMIEDARLDARATQLEAVSLGVVGGAMVATLTARGPVDAWAGTAKVRARRIRAGAASLDTLSVDGDVRGVLGAIAGQVSVRATGLSVGDERLGTLDLSAEGTGDPLNVDLDLRGGRRLRALAGRLTVHRDADVVSFHIPSLDAETKSARWHVADARVSRTRDGRVEVSELAIASRHGRLTLNAQLGPQPLSSPGWVRAELVELDVGRLLDDLALPGSNFRGLASGRVSAQLGPAPRAELALSMEAASYVGLAGTLRASVGARLSRNTVTASLAVSGADLGRIDLAARLAAPPTPFEPAAWTRMGTRGVRSVDGRIEGLRLARLSPVAAFLGGTLDLTLHAGRALDDAALDLHARNVRHRSYPGPFGARATAVATADTTRLSASVGIADVPLAGAMARVETGLRALLDDPAEVLRARDGSLEFELSSFPIALLEDWVPEPPGVRVARQRSVASGELTVRGSVQRKAHRPSGAIHLQGLDLRWIEGAPQLSSSATVTIDGTALTLNADVTGKTLGSLLLEAKAHTPRDPTELTGWRTLGVRAVESLRLDATGLDLSAVDRISDRRFPWVGKLTARLDAREALQRVDAYVKASRVGRRDSAVRTDGVLALTGGRDRTHAELTLYDDARLVFTATASAPAGPASMIRGDLDLAQMQIEAGAALEAFPLRTISEATRSKIPMRGTVTASIAFRGSSRDYLARAHLDAGGAVIAKQRFDRLVVDARIDPRRLRARADVRQTRGGRLDLAADLDLAQGGVLDGTLRASEFRIDALSVLAQRSGSVGGVTGVLDADLRLEGTPQAPSGHGRLRLDALGVVLGAPLPPIEAARVDLALDDRALNARFSGRSGRGTLEGEVRATFASLMEPSFELTLETDAVPVVVGPRTALIDATVVVKGRIAELIETEVRIERASIEVPNASGHQLAQVNKMPDVVFVDAQRRVATSTAGEPATPVRAQIRTVASVPIHGSEVAAQARVDLRFDGTDGVMRSSGKVSVGDGWVSLFGKRWQIQRADILFDGDRPRVEVEISRDVGAATAIVRVRGDLAAPELELSSNPPIFDEAEVLMFVLGVDPSDDREGGGALKDRAAGAAVGALVGALQAELEDQLPLDTIDVKVDDGARISRLEVGKWITNRVFLGYQYAFDADSDENSNEALVEVRLGRGWVLESRYGDRGVGGIDFIWVHRF